MSKQFIKGFAIRTQAFLEAYAKRWKAPKSSSKEDLKPLAGFACKVSRALRDLDAAAERWAAEGIAKAAQTEHSVRRKGAAAVRRAARRNIAQVSRTLIVVAGHVPPPLSKIVRGIRSNVIRMAQAVDRETVNKTVPVEPRNPRLWEEEKAEGFRTLQEENPTEAFDQAEFDRLCELDVRSPTQPLSLALRASTATGRAADYLSTYGGYASSALQIGSGMALTTATAGTLATGVVAAASVGPQAVVGVPVAAAGGIFSAGMGLLGGSLAVGSKLTTLATNAARDLTANQEEARINREAAVRNAASKVLHRYQMIEGTQPRL